MKKKYYIIIAIFFFLDIVILSILYYLQEPTTLNPDILRQDFPKHLIIASRNGLVKFVIDPTTYQYKEIATIKDIVARHIVVIDKEIFCYQDNIIYQIDENFTIKNCKKLKKITAITNNHQNIFIASQRNFIILGKNLEELGKIDLAMQEEKEVDSIIVYNNMAYLMDNLIIPIYLFHVDITDVKHPKVLERITMEVKTGHPSNQWLNTELNQWLVSYIYMTGSPFVSTNVQGHSVFITSMDKSRVTLDTMRIENCYFSETHFRKPEKLFYRLKNATKENDLVSFYLRERFSKEFQEKMNGYQNQTELSKDILNSLAKEFNLLLPHYDLYNEDYFINIAKELKEKIQQARKNSLDTTLLNRRLLEEIYPDLVTYMSFGIEDHQMEKAHFIGEKKYHILAVTPFPPIYFIIAKRDKNSYNCYLARVNSENGKISLFDILPLKNFSCVFNLKQGTVFSREEVHWSVGLTLGVPSLKYKNNYLFLASGTKINVTCRVRQRAEKNSEEYWGKDWDYKEWENEIAKDKKMHVNLIKIVDVKDKPKVIFSKDFDEYGLGGILDILAY